MPRELSLAGLAGETDSDPELLVRLTQIGVLRPTREGVYTAGDIIRVEAARSFLDSGLGLGDISNAIESGLFTFEFLDRFHPEPAPRTGQTLSQLAVSLGIDSQLLGATYLALGLTDPGPDRALRQDEEAILVAFVNLWGIDEETLLRAARLIGEPARIVSEGWARLFVEKISQPVSASSDLSVEEQISAIAGSTERATRLVPLMLQWLLQRHMRHAIDQVNIEGFEQTMAEHGLALPSPARLPAIAFVDISGYTSMTEAEGDDRALRASEVIRDRASIVARAHHGTLVKILGDGAMLHFADVADAIEAITQLVAGLKAYGLSAHAGIHAGSLIARDGDYYGRTVNLASRVAAVAGPGQVLVTKEVVEAIAGEGRAFAGVKTMTLKGIDEPVTLYSLATDQL